MVVGKNGTGKMEIMALSCIFLVIFSNESYTCFSFDFLYNVYFNMQYIV